MRAWVFVCIVVNAVVSARNVTFYEMCAGNSEHYVHYLAMAHVGLVCYTFAPVSASLYSISGLLEPYIYRLSICQNMCPSHSTLSIHTHKDLHNIGEAIKYFEKVSPKKPESGPRYYDLGYNSDAGRWEDYSPPDFREYLEDFYEQRGCHTFDVKEMKPAPMKCETASSVVMCEHRCEDCTIDAEFLTKIK